MTDEISATATYSKTQYDVSNELTAVTIDGFGFNVTNYEEVFVPLDYSILENNDGMIYSLLAILPLLLMIIPVIIVVRLVTNGRD